MGNHLHFDFERVMKRHGTGSRKWDATGTVFGNSAVLPLWIADMDFASPPAVVQRLNERVRHSRFLLS